MSGKRGKIVLSKGRRLSFPCLIEHGEFGSPDLVRIGKSVTSPVLRSDLSPALGEVCFSQASSRGSMRFERVEGVWSVSFRPGCWRGFGWDGAGGFQTIVFGRGRRGKKAARRFCAASEKASGVL